MNLKTFSEVLNLAETQLPIALYENKVYLDCLRKFVSKLRKKLIHLGVKTVHLEMFYLTAEVQSKLISVVHSCVKRVYQASETEFETFLQVVAEELREFITRYLSSVPTEWQN